MPKTQFHAELPKEGLSRFEQFANLLPFSREKFRRLGLQNRAPKPIRLGSRITFYRNSELHKFFANPTDYQAEEDANECK